MYTHHYLDLDEASSELIVEHAATPEYVVMHDEKLDNLERLVAELSGAPLLVAYEFMHDRDRIRPWSYEFDPAGLELLRRAIDHVAAERPAERLAEVPAG